MNFFCLYILLAFAIFQSNLAPLKFALSIIKTFFNVFLMNGVSFFRLFLLLSWFHYLGMRFRVLVTFILLLCDFPSKSQSFLSFILSNSLRLFFHFFPSNSLNLSFLFIKVSFLSIKQSQSFISFHQTVLVFSFSASLPGFLCYPTLCFSVRIVVFHCFPTLCFFATLPCVTL